MSAKFQLDQHVKLVGDDQIRTVQRVLEFFGEETLYAVQLGEDASNREWAKESELEQAG